jgi:diacylglycerol kinase (ATP)
MTTKRFSLPARAKSFVYAGRGLRVMIASQHNAWVHGVATLGVIGGGFVFGVARTEWLMLILAIVSVWTAESLNTAFEFLCDVASPDFHPLVEKAKDVAAGAVLVAALGATAIGLLVFVPHLRALLAG